MSKRLLIAFLVVLPGISHAQSSVTLYGTMGGGLRWANGTKGGNLLSYNNNIIDGNDFGIKGREDLGGGLKAVFVLDGSFASGTGAAKTSGLLFSQAAYVGLVGGFGRLTFGRQLNAAEDLGVILDPIGANAQSMAIAPEVVYGANFFTLDSRFNNTIKYMGRFGGLRIGGSYSPGGVAGNTRAGTNYSAAALYQFQTALGGLMYEKTYSPTAAQWAQTIEAGGTLQLGPARLYLIYTTLTVTGSRAGAPSRRDKIPTGGIVYQITPSVQFTAAVYDDIARDLGNVKGASGHKLTFYAIAEYFLSKRTEVYAEVDRNGFTGAYKNDPTNLAALNLRPGASATTGVSIGLMTRF